MQVAASMAIEAAENASWFEVFEDFKGTTGLFPTGSFDLPSIDNPRTAEGMHWNAREYLDFVESFGSNLLSEDRLSNVLQDRIANLPVRSSPLEADPRDWHYGLGFWVECPTSPYDCQSVDRISSAGAYGAYPFYDFADQYWGIVARQGQLGTEPNSYAVYEAIESLAESWARSSCTTSS